MGKLRISDTKHSNFITYRGSARARHCFDCARFGHCVQTSAQNSARARAPGAGT